MEKKAKRTAGILLIVLGSFFLMLGLLVGGMFLAVGGVIDSKMEQQMNEFSSFREDALTTTGEVTDADSDAGNTTFGYYAETDGSWYEVTYEGYSSNFTEGTAVTVYYDKNDPGVCMIPEFVEGSYGLLKKIFTLVGGIVGGIFVVIGLPMLIGGIVVKKKAASTYEN